MSNSYLEKDIDQIIKGMSEAASLEVEKIQARCREIEIQMKPLAARCSALLVEIEKKSPDDRQSRFDKIMSEGMSYEELARYAAEGWSWATYLEDAHDKVVQHRDIEGELHELSDELKALVKHRDEVISTLDEIGLAASHKAEVLEERCNAYQEKKILVATLREEEKKPRARGGKNRFASTEYPETKIKVLKEWEKWPNKSAHGVRTAFAKKMLTKYSVLKSIEVVLRWIRERDNEENGKCDSAS